MMRRGVVETGPPKSQFQMGGPTFLICNCWLSLVNLVKITLYMSHMDVFLKCLF